MEQHKTLYPEIRPENVVIPKGQKPPAPEGQSMVLYRATTKKRRNAVVYEMVTQVARRTGSGACDAEPA